MIFLVLAALVQANGGLPEVPALDTYFRCIATEAQRLSSSEEPAETVSIAVLTNCRPLLTPAARATDRTSDELLRRRGWKAGGGSILELEEQLEEKAREIAVTIIVEERLEPKRTSNASN